MKRAVLFSAVALVLMLVAAGCGGGGAAAGGNEIKVTASDYKFTPADITVKRGEAITITLENKGSVEHDWVAEAINAKFAAVVKPGQTGKLTFTASQAGTFDFHCTVPGHKELGMVGKITVQ